MTASRTHPPEMFDLSEIYPFWRGQRAAFIRAPLIAGISGQRTELTGAHWAVISVITTHDYDGVYEDIGEIIGADDSEAGTSTCHELLAIRTRDLLATNPSWTPIGGAVLPRSVLPATGTVLDGDPLPVHVCGAKVGNEKLYDSVYVRCYLCPTDGSSDRLTNLLARLSSDGLASLNDSLVSYLTRRGKQA